MPPHPKEMAGKIRRVINGFIFLEKRTVFRQGKLRLYPSEIHLMQVIHEEPELNAGEMARRLGLTNGAVSQTLARLEKKGVLRKSKDPALKNKLTATFTKSGMAAIQGFSKEQASAIEAFSAYLTGLSGREREVIDGFLSHMEAFPKMLK